MTRGQRNNNPANIRKGSAWKGLACVQDDRDFCVFKTTFYGIRALVIVLRTYVMKYHLKTVDKMIARFAPTSENDTAEYVRRVLRAYVSPPVFDITDFLGEGSWKLYTLCKVICHVESNYFLPEWQFHEVLKFINRKEET